MNNFLKIGDTYIDPIEVNYFKTANSSVGDRDGIQRSVPATYFKLKSGDFLIVNGVTPDEVANILGAPVKSST